ncbi:PREDICTED: NAC domain-containing protein 37-like [Ipomoea nil]|uniref:NAC domain-containing protein 37-like n=1 Tax=Ipomoea nil TaxID=35883 RepID=UPI0009019318|nr:PREDICTED: NAC domain-containing protein 37-like [Ipomoea nil]
MSGFCGSNDSVESSPVEKDSGDSIRIPLGYRFYPTDEELINHFLRRKIEDPSFFTTDIEVVDLNSSESGVHVGERKRFFFCRRDMIMKYATGQIQGFWESTGEDREIFKGKALIGMKETMIFYRGRAPSAERTNWVMHEYRLEDDNLPQNAKNEWVIREFFLENKTYIPPYVLQTLAWASKSILDHDEGEVGKHNVNCCCCCRRSSLKRKDNNNEYVGGVMRQLKPKLTTMEENSIVFRVRFNNDTVRLQPRFATMDFLKAAILNRFKTLESVKFYIQYKDGEGYMITLAIDEDLHYCLEFFKSTGSPVTLSLADVLLEP